jgi:antitoxin (DNA-binding transcriptional repressor) of toxin-antitoxin stability system
MRNVSMAELKAHLARYLRQVRQGRTLTILDGDTPVARIVPWLGEVPLDIRRATRKPRDLRVSSVRAATTDSLLALLQDRASR